MKKLFLLPMMFVGALLFQGCESDDLLQAPDQVVEANFQAQYTDVSRVEWEQKGNFWVVDFVKDDREMEAWYSVGGEWFQTETDLLFNDLPEAVRTAFQTGEYRDWQVEDVDMMERRDAATFYVLDVELGEQDLDLLYLADGTLFQVGESDDLIQAPDPDVEANFQAQYTGVSRVEWEWKGNFWAVDFVKDGREMEAWYSVGGEWLQTETDLLFNDLPEAVRTAFLSGEYRDWQVEDVDMMEGRDVATFYVLDVELGEQDLDLHYSADGTFIKAQVD